jgi:membrane-associated protease RseP (regulator of RpoE activity)
MRRSVLRVGVALAPLVLLPSPGSAQTVGEGGERGWIGISVEILTTVEGERARTAVIVTGVNPGSPASVAGIRRGDRVISLAGLPWARLVDDEAWTIRPGDPVALVLERDGVRSEIQVTAARRPAEVPYGARLTVTVRADSIVDRLYRAMDSLRISLFQEAGRVAVVGSRAGESGRIAVVGSIPDAGSPRPSRPTAAEGEPKLYAFPTFERPDAPGWRLPFSLHLLQGSLDDSLRREMDALGRELAEVRRLEAGRIRELAEALRPSERRIDRSDPELLRLGARRSELSRRRSDLQEVVMARALEAGDSRLPLEVSVEDTEGLALRPLAPYVLGQNRVAGAQIVDLRRELAEYFRVQAGVLVVDVPEGTPAARAGLQPGDVITHVDGSVVASIKDLRLGLARTATELPLGLVRKGAPMQVLLRR